MTNFMKTTVLAGLALGVSGAALAQGMTPRQQAEYRRNCTADYTRLCSEYEADSPEVQMCFQQKLSQVSKRCRATIAKFRQGR